MIKVSVIVPIYNAEKYLNKCIESIVKQTYKNIEIILVDDGSIDSSLQICNKYQTMDNRVIVVHKANEGLVAARKTGIRYSTGTYITFVDADDYIDVDTYEILLHRMGTRLSDIVAFDLIEEYPDYIVRKYNRFTEGIYNVEKIQEDILPYALSYGHFFEFGLLPNLVCKMIRREFLEKVSIEVDDCITVGEDADFTYQLLANADTLQLIDFAPYHYCKRNNSMMWKGINFESIKQLKRDLERAFRKADILPIMEKQLEEYITFILLLKCPEAVREINDIFAESGIALYGAGGFGQSIHAVYKMKIPIWVDRNYLRYKESGYRIEAIDILLSRQESYGAIFIAILNSELCEEIKGELISMGIEKPIYYYGR